MLSCLCDWCTQKNTCGPSEHAQPPYFYLPGVRVGAKCCAEGSNNKRGTALHEMQTCMLPRELIWEGWLPLKTWYDTVWKVTQAAKRTCKACEIVPPCVLSHCAISSAGNVNVNNNKSTKFLNPDPWAN